MKDAAAPIRKQYMDIKRRYPQAIVLFRIGDFYETFDEDAKTVASELDIILTSKEMGKGYRVPLAGIPYHSLDNHLAKLVSNGHKVAICEQTTLPGASRGLVERAVVRVVTPGTVVETGMLESKANNYLVGIAFGDTEAGIAYVDITTSEFAVTQLPIHRVLAELERLQPSEIIAPYGADFSSWDIKIPLSRLENYYFDLENARQTMLEHFSAASLDGYGCANLPLAVRAAGAIIHYVKETQMNAASQINRLSTYSTESFMPLDKETLQNLELAESRSSAAGSTLLSVLDLTRTPMGGRLLRKWISQPLLDLQELLKRQNAVQWFYDNALPRTQIGSFLSKTADLERIINRIRSGIAHPRELIALKHSLELLPEVITQLEACPLDWLKSGLKPQNGITALIAQAIADEPSPKPGDGSVIRQDFSEELDKLRLISRDAKQFLANLERQEQERTGIKSLKVGYNHVFGYYIEISKSNLPQAPESYIRKQTLTNGERFYTPELKEYEALILNARDRIAEMETDIYRRICRQIADSAEPIMTLAAALAKIDSLSSLAEAAVKYSYIRPKLNDEGELIIKEGRHPVVERSLPEGTFIPNDAHLSNNNAQLIILTGPNMAGKSTYLKQVALITLMAQIGSFVPASSAVIGIVDRIFTRIGAREDLSSGQSTFMMEMVETANILNNATPRSLLILDEIGRGTSTYDGLAIARAVAEYIHNSPGLGAKTLFATHYHELVELADTLPRVRNYNVAVTEERGKVIFLRRIIPGGVDRSYGVHVAQLAGLPKAVVRRAHEALAELEAGSKSASKEPKGKTKHGAAAAENQPPQLPLFGQRSPVMEELSALDINSLTPLEALNKLYELKKKAGA